LQRQTSPASRLTDWIIAPRDDVSATIAAHAWRVDSTARSRSSSAEWSTTSWSLRSGRPVTQIHCSSCGSASKSWSERCGLSSATGRKSSGARRRFAWERDVQRAPRGWLTG